MSQIQDSESFQHEFFETTSVRDFLARPKGAPPESYPVEPTPDRYTPDCFEGDYEARRRALFAHCRANPAAPTIKGFYYELVRIASGHAPVYGAAIDAALDYVAERYDCADFVLLGIQRLLFQFGAGPLVSPGLIEKAEATLLGFKYWPDEPGIDSMCSWTENHQIMFSTNEYLAGSFYPDRTFSNSGMKGRDKAARAKSRIRDWMELRFKTGFNEWLSNVYFDEDLTALINLVDFAPDEEIALRAASIADLLLFDIALNSFRGCFVSSHGRSYSREKSSALLESTTDTSKLLFGRGIFAGADNMSAVSIGLSEKYRMPRVLFEVANDAPAAPVVNRQRAGIRIDEAKSWGIDYRNDEGAMKLLSFEAYAHPKTFAHTLRLFDKYRWWQNQFFAPFGERRALIELLRRSGLHHLVTRLFKRDLNRNTRQEVNLYTYRTTYYQLSCAQDYYPGYGGDQQHIWQATLGPEAVCYTTHPGSLEESSCGFWTGSGTLPRVAQVENVLISVYRISRMPGLYRTNHLFFTHAWLPTDRFDEIVDSGGWIFARKGDAYLALLSARPHGWHRGPPAGLDLRERAAHLMAPATAQPETGSVEVRADGETNIWICELGSRDQDGAFSDFAERIRTAPLNVGRDFMSVLYRSPSRGSLEFGWRGGLRHEGNCVPLHGYPRYDNPYCRAEFPPERITIECAGERLEIDWASGVRKVSRFV